MNARVLPRLAAALAAVAFLATGCRWSGVSDLPLPGGAGSGPAYHVTAVFDDVMDLVPQSSVRVNDVAVGSVESITLGSDMRARVRMRIKDSVRLPANSVAVLQQTSLLGEKYVAILPPTAAQPTGELRDGATIPAMRTNDAATVEEVFTGLSALLNGGGLQQLQTISTELTKATSGREGDIRDLLSQLRTFVGDLDRNRAGIVRALDALDNLSSTLARQKDTIATALDDIAPGLKVLADQRPQIVSMLTALSHLGTVATAVIKASKADTVADLAALRPILGELDTAGHNLPTALELLLDYPFPKTATNAMKGDYTGLRITFDLDASLASALSPPSSGGSLPSPTGGGQPGPLPTPSLPSVPHVPLPSLPPLPPLPGLSSSQGADTDGGLAGLLLGGLQ